MKNLLFMFLLFVSFVAQSACRIDGDGKNDDTITLDVTFDLSNKLLSISQEQNLAFTKISLAYCLTIKCILLITLRTTYIP